MHELTGARVRLRPAQRDDVAALIRIRSTPEVRMRWRGDDLEAEIVADLRSDDLHLLAIEDESGEPIGAIQWEEESDPDYRNATIDIFLDPAKHGQGYGTEAVRTLVHHLIRDRGHHRLTIDPAADNQPAIRCYRKVGFRPVGTLRQYERGPDGTWHDGVLMELLASDLEGEGDPTPVPRCSCCGTDRGDVVALRCHDEVKICRDCVGWLGTQAGLVDATPILPVGDLSSAIAFYEAAGFQVRRYQDGGYAFIHYDDVSVFDLGVADRPSAGGANTSSCYLTVPDVDTWHARLEAAGLAVSELDDKPWGMREFTLTDPDGNCIRLGQPST